MKKCTALFIAVLMLIMSVFPVTAVANDETINCYVEYFDDGSYIITEIATSNISTMATSTKTHKKTSSYYDADNKKLWTVNLTGTFTYTGNSATCTKATTSYTIYDSKWKVTSATASKNSRTATGDFTVKRYTLGIPTKTINKALTITCSNTGVCS